MTDLEIAFEETGEQLDRIISALRREKPTPPNPLTKAYWSDNVVTEYNIVGDINYQNFDCWERYPNTLIKVEIGNTVTQIGEHAFEACDSLEEVSIPKILLPNTTFPPTVPPLAWHTLHRTEYVCCSTLISNPLYPTNFDLRSSFSFSPPQNGHGFNSVSLISAPP